MGIRKNWKSNSQLAFVLLLLAGALFWSGQTRFALAQRGAPAAATIYLPAVFKAFNPACTTPAIVFDSVPPLGSTADLYGHVACANPAQFSVAVYINVGGWWTKPTFAEPLTAIHSDGTFVVDITTGGGDPQATDIAGFLIPAGYSPPLMSGGAVLPDELFTHSAAYTTVSRRLARTLAFSGYTWTVKYASTLTGPGPNYFSDDPADVWVDGNGYLHLRIVNRDGKWYSSEVICNEILQYGAYTATLASRVDLLDKNVVLGFFTWDDDAPQYNYRELDVEFSRWTEDTPLNAQYVVQPWDVSGNRQRFAMNLSSAESVHRIDWHAERVQFDSWTGDGAPLQSWTYSNPAYIPPPGAGHVHLNLWLINGWAPSDGQAVEVIIKSVQF